MLVATVSFTSHLRRVAPPGEQSVQGASVGEALAVIFDDAPQLKGYVLDDRGRLRKHVCIFLDGTRLNGDAVLAAEISETSEIYVMQALSGG